MAVLLVSGCATQELRFKEAKGRDDIAAYEAFLEEYPQGEFAEQARVSIAQLKAEKEWREAEERKRLEGARADEERRSFAESRGRDTTDAYEEFIRKYPNSSYVSEARALLFSKRSTPEERARRLQDVKVVKLAVNKQFFSVGIPTGEGAMRASSGGRKVAAGVTA